jgi:hypothetical protein
VEAFQRRARRNAVVLPHRRCLRRLLFERGSTRPPSRRSTEQGLAFARKRQMYPDGNAYSSLTDWSNGPTRPLRSICCRLKSSGCGSRVRIYLARHDAGRSTGPPHSTPDFANSTMASTPVTMTTSHWP